MKIDIIPKNRYSEYLELFNTCFPHAQYNYECYNWFNLCPTGENRNYGIFNKEDKIIGSLSVLPINIFLNKTLVNGVLLRGGMIHQKYRGKNLFVKLEKYLIERERELGTSVFLGAPNINIFRSHLKVGLRVFANLDFIAKFCFNKKKKKCKQIQIFDDRFNKLQHEIAKRSNFIIYKDKDFLNWRYFQNPINKYLVYANFVDDKPVGWMAIKQFNDCGYLKTHILDISALDFDTFNNLINQAEHLAMGRHELNAWQIDNSMYYNWFKKLGFIPTINKNILMTFELSKKIIKSNWWFALGDNDVY